MPVPKQGDHVKIGMATAFTVHYRSVKVLRRFLQNCGFKLVRSPRTTPEILAGGTTLTSADFCIPVRTFVGHVDWLVRNHPDLDFLILPNVCGEIKGAKTCSKYRDAGGIALRSVGNTVGYLAGRTSPRLRERLRALVGEPAMDQIMEVSRGIPRLLQPSIRSLDKDHLRNTCFRVYADVMGLGRLTGALQYLVPRPLRGKWAPHFTRVQEAFDAAYNEVMGREPAVFGRIFRDAGKPRVALIGREYLLEDPLLSSDLKSFLRRAGAEVLTPWDVPFSELQDTYRRTPGFYDTHRLFEAFIEWAAPHVDGFVLGGSFGCHPDAFQMEFFLDRIREMGMPAWLFKYDETTGSAGFQTRYETVMGFLTRRRDQRLAAGTANLVAPDESGRGMAPAVPIALSGPERSPKQLKPAIIWPHMSPIVDLVVEEIFHQAGLGDYLFPPLPLSETTIELGDHKYTESCCPYAFSTGSLRESISAFMESLVREAAADGREVEPRRILLLQGRGEGPCTYGWYSIVQARDLPEMFKDELSRWDHTLEMATVGLSGIVDLIRELARLGNTGSLRGIVRYIEALDSGRLRTCGPAQRTALTAGLAASIRSLSRTAWVKLDAAEDLRRRSLVLRAHELRRGNTTSAYRRALELLRPAHTVSRIRAAHAEGLRLLEAVPRDGKIKPRVTVVGEIYVALSSFANRGTVENILGAEGIEIVEGITLGKFLRTSLAEMKRRSYVNKGYLRPILEYLSRDLNIYLFEEQKRGRLAMPFATHDVGGEGIVSVAEARKGIEEGAHGILHIYPFKCMPEGIAKTALSEMCDLYSVRYLPISFGKETEVERLRTELATFAELLRLGVRNLGAHTPDLYRERLKKETLRRRRLGAVLTGIHEREAGRTRAR
ncbi:MAG: hypothetical protein HYY09_07910 [Firmicutes bacterium]|nr:hypothetical protein [Bacillota bacterium]